MRQERDDADAALLKAGGGTAGVASESLIAQKDDDIVF